MFDQYKTRWDIPRIKKLTDARSLGLYVFLIVVLAISWSGVKTIQSNYDLQKRISTLRQQNAVLQLQNENTALQNQYLKTDQYLDLAARQDLGLAGPGEKILLIPKTVALKYVDQTLAPVTQANSSTTDNRSKYIKNLEGWRDFLLGRNIVSD